MATFRRDLPPRPLSTFLGVVGGWALILTASGCATGGPSQDETPFTQTADPLVDSESLVEVFDHIEVNAEVFDPIQDLAKARGVTEVFVGKVIGVTPGPALSSHQGATRTTLVFVSPTAVYKGHSEVGDEIGITIPYSIDSEAFAEALPAGSLIGLYGSYEVQERGDKDSRLMPVSPQAFMVEESDGVGVVWPIDRRHDVSTELAKQMPGDSARSDP